MRKVIDDTRGDLIYGAFWNICGWKRMADVAGQAKRLGPDRMIVTGCREWRDGELLGEKQQIVRICPSDKSHDFQYVIEEATYIGDEPENTTCLYPAANSVVVTRRIANRVAAKRFKGLSIIELERSNQVNREGQNLEQLALLQGTPKIIARDLRLIPDGAKNECHNCGFGPIQCLTCNDGFFHCPQCRVKCVVAFDSTLPSDEKRLVFYRDPDQPVVLNGAAWEGEDAILGGTSRTAPVYTRRFLDFLLGIHMEQIAAITIPVFAGECSAEQRRRIENLALGKY